MLLRFANEPKYHSFKSVLIPQKDDKGLSCAMHECLAAQEGDNLEKPLGIFRANEEEFILCYEGECLFSL